jgi:hypothetical protein
MYFLLYLINLIVSAVAFYWSFQNAFRKPGTPTFGLFRYVEIPGQKTADAPEETPRQPSRASWARR